MYCQENSGILTVEFSVGTVYSNAIPAFLDCSNNMMVNGSLIGPGELKLSRFPLRA